MKCYDMQTYARNPDELNEIAPTVLSHWGTGGGQHRVRVLALDGDKWKVRPKDNYERAGGNGFGINGGGACTR